MEGGVVGKKALCGNEGGVVIEESNNILGQDMEIRQVKERKYASSKNFSLERERERAWMSRWACSMP